jgi:hypothetical protein
MTWRTKADAWFYGVVADPNRLFTADDLEDAIGHPDDEHEANGRNNSIGAAFAHAHKIGLIEPAGVTRSRQPKRKGGMVRVWKAATSQGRLL